MSKIKAIGNAKFPAEKLGGWDGLITEAEQRIQELQFSIRVFERKKAAGEQCPAKSPKSDSELIQRASA